MTIDEANSIIQEFSKIDCSKLEVTDQLIALQALDDFATAVKPIVLKQSVMQPGSFLMKL